MGDVGTGQGEYSGFPPGILDGGYHVRDAVAAQAAAELELAFNEMSQVPCGRFIGTTLGNEQVLTPNVYCLDSAAILTGNLYLDGGCDPNAFFLFKVNGSLSTGTVSKVVLLHAASTCNIYWQINGAFNAGDLSEFKGTMIARGPIHLLEGAVLIGRGLSLEGGIFLHNNIAAIDGLPEPAAITASSPTTFFEGGTTTLDGNCGGTWSNGMTSSSIRVTTSGEYFVTNTNACGSTESNHIVVTVKPWPVSTISGDNSRIQKPPAGPGTPEADGRPDSPPAKHYAVTLADSTKCCIVYSKPVHPPSHHRL